ncbi:MAG TPA: metallophosphoesterase [Trueperaceae bacterium]
MQLFVIGDIHTQAEKFWRMLQEAGLSDTEKKPTERLHDPDVSLVLLGDLVHGKSRERYAELAGVARYDEYNPEHLAAAEAAQVAFLGDVKRFYDLVPEGHMTILMGNHDFNAVTPDQGPLRTDDITHLEWKDGYGSQLPPDLAAWIAAWPYEIVVEGIHLAHVGPRPEHNRYDNGFYLENRRRWIYEEQDFLEGTTYRLGIYGHTPVRGGVNITSQGRAILLDTNGQGEEYVFLEIGITPQGYHLKMRGLFFDECIQR